MNDDEHAGLALVEVASLCDADEHTVTSPLIDLRSMYVIVDDVDPAQWPPDAPAVWTRTWAQVLELLPWDRRRGPVPLTSAPGSWLVELEPPEGEAR